MLWSSLLVLLALFLLWSWFWRQWYRLTHRSDEIHFAQTRDGWHLALSHYRPQGTSRQYPIILCPGLASNRYSFDLREDLSLARTLASHGFDVWTLELRGHGYSDRPWLWGTKRFGFDFDDYLKDDLPTAIEYVRQQTGKDKVHWLGHSMGGILMLCHLGTTQDPAIVSATTVGSALHLYKHNSWYKAGLLFRPVAPFVPGVPLGWSHLLAPLAGRLEHNPSEEFLLHTANTRSQDIRRIISNTFHTVSTPVLLQMAGALGPEGLRSRDRKTSYTEQLGSIRTPVLMLGADLDHQCPQSAVEATFAALKTPAKELVLLGKEQGQKQSYGHFDLLTGERANTEVFPSILRWLERHDAKKSS
jgi:pimeloyl-ACP methyl ester carboxylesterase